MAFQGFLRKSKRELENGRNEKLKRNLSKVIVVGIWNDLKYLNRIKTRTIAQIDESLK